MTLSIVLSFIGEGTTDSRFLPNIAERIVEQLLIEYNVKATIQWQHIQKEGNSSEEVIFNAAKQARFCTTLIVHSDADKAGAKETYKNKIKPALGLIDEAEEVCKNITVVIPITETEAWLLVDRELLKEEINTSLSYQDLGLTYQIGRIENIADPKKTLNDAINVHHSTLSKKRRKSAVTISQLYEPISQKIKLNDLKVLTAYVSFKEGITTSLKSKNII